MSVSRIVDTIAEELGVNTKYEYTGGDRDRTGSVSKMRLSIGESSVLDRELLTSSDEAVRPSDCSARRRTRLIASITGGGERALIEDATRFPLLHISICA